MKKLLILIGAVALLAGCNQKKEVALTASGLNPENFVDTFNDAPTALYTLTNANGMEVCITNFGGRIVSILVPDNQGQMQDVVVLGFDKVSDYFPENNQTDFGASIGRYANRINQGQDHPGLPKGCSFLEDYTLNFAGDRSSCLQSHMLEICPMIAVDKPKLEVHFLGIGIRKQPTARLVFTSKTGFGIKATVVDLGNRFRLIAQDVECIEPKPMPHLPVASALWVPQPTFEIGAGAWILAGGTHHSAFSYDIDAEYWDDFAEMTGIEFVHISKDTTIEGFKKELRTNEVYYMLNKALK